MALKLRIQVNQSIPKCFRVRVFRAARPVSANRSKAGSNGSAVSVFIIVQPPPPPLVLVLVLVLVLFDVTVTVSAALFTTPSLTIS